MPVNYHETKMLRRDLPGISLLLVAISLASCGGKIKVVKVTPPAARPVVLDATREELLEKYNATARSVKSLNATVELKPTAGSKYSGVIEEYHEVKRSCLPSVRPAFA